MPTAPASRCAGTEPGNPLCGLEIHDQGFGHLSNLMTNRYMAILGGDHGLTVINGPGEGTLVIAKDSFGLPLASMLIPYFKKLILIDERHYTGEKPSKVIAKEKPVGVLMLHSITPMHGENFNLSIWG